MGEPSHKHTTVLLGLSRLNISGGTQLGRDVMAWSSGTGVGSEE